MDEDIEYKIPETERILTEQQNEDIAVNKQQPETEKNLTFLRNIDKRKIILPLGIFIVILLAYKAFNFYEIKKTQRMKQQKAQMQNVIVEPVVVIPQKPIYVAEPSMPEVNNNQNYDALNQKISKIETNIYQNDAKLNDLNSNVNVIQENIVAVDKNVKQISDVLQQELAQVEQLKQSLNKPIKQHKIKKPNIIKYHIRAMVPGRAWIESADGRYSKTLKVGDELAGYGVVDYILYKDGIILMSDGSYIQYGENDN